MLGALLMELFESLSGSDEPYETPMEEGTGEVEVMLPQSRDYSLEVLHEESHDHSLLSSTATPNAIANTTK